jgi:hypothetical protein
MIIFKDFPTQPVVTLDRELEDVCAGEEPILLRDPSFANGNKGVMWMMFQK